MITNRELQDIARKSGVKDLQIEKDYMLTWLLAGIAQDETLQQHFCFKGGTLLKKCYFNDYRFSEDLDFTMINGTISAIEVQNSFDRIKHFIKKKSGNEISVLGELSPNQHNVISFYVGYISVLGGLGANKKIKVDISTDEKIISSIEKRMVFNNYTDQPKSELLCYSLEEVIAEKMCAVMSRMQPRDVYDLWYLFDIHGLNITDYYKGFSEKAKNKGIDPTLFSQKMSAKFNDFEQRWKPLLQSQIKDLPEFEMVKRNLGKHLRSIKTMEDEYRKFSQKENPKVQKNKGRKL